MMITWNSLSLLLHLVAIALWLGGIVFFLVVIGPAVRIGLVFDLVSVLLFSLLLVAGVLTVVKHRTLQWTTGMFVLLAVTVRWAGFSQPGSTNTIT